MDEVGGDIQATLRVAARQTFLESRYDEGQAAFENAEDVACAREDVPGAIIARLGSIDARFLASHDYGLGSGAAGCLEREFQDVAREFAAIGDPAGQAYCLTRRGWLTAISGDIPRADAYLKQAECLAATIDDQHTRSHVHYGRALIASITGAPSQAIAELRQCELLRQRIGDVHGIGVARISIAMMAAREHNFGAGMLMLESAADLFRSVGDERAVTATRVHMSRLAADLQLHAVPHAGLLPGCSAGDSGRGLVAALKQIAEYGSALVATPTSAGAPQGWPA
jgi:hypothetical protein